MVYFFCNFFIFIYFLISIFLTTLIFTRNINVFQFDIETKNSSISICSQMFCEVSMASLESNSTWTVLEKIISSYFNDTWFIDNYPMYLWSVFETNTVRTNNDVKGWHNLLKKVVWKAHQNIFKIVNIFKKE